MSRTLPASFIKNIRRPLVAAVLALLAALCAGAVSAVSQPSLVWTRTHNGAENGYDLVYGIAVGLSGCVLAAGSEVAVDASLDDWVVSKYGANGSLAWSDRYNSKADDSDVALSVVEAPSGDILAAGYETRSDLGEDANALVRRYDSGGNLLWSTSYNDPGDGYDTARGITLDPSGNIIVAGDSDVGALLIKYNSTGDILWSTVFHGSFGAGDSFNSVACDPAGNIFVAGYMDNTIFDSDWLVCKYSPAGVQQWALTVPETTIADDSAMAVAVDALGNAYVAGYTNRLMATQGSDWALRKYSPAGSLLWERFYDGPSHSIDNVGGVAVDSDGGAVIAGDTEAFLMMRKYLPDGSLGWVATHSNPLSSLDTPYSVAIRGPVIAVGGGELRMDLSQDFNWLVLRYEYFYDLSISAQPVHPGEVLTVILTVTNVGDAVMKGTGAALDVVSGSSVITPVSSPSGGLSDLNVGASRFYTWTYLAREEGVVKFTANVSGTEFGTGATGYESSLYTVPIAVRPTVTLWLDEPGAALDRNVFIPGQDSHLQVRIFPREPGDVAVKIYTASGRLVRTLPSTQWNIGGGQFVRRWDGMNDGGAHVQRGVYLVAVEGGGIRKKLKVVVR